MNEETLVRPIRNNTDFDKTGKKYLEEKMPVEKINRKWFENFLDTPSLYSEREQGVMKQFIYKLYKTTIEPEHYIFGERFLMMFKNGKIHLTHPKWSLSGVGNSLLDAELDLIKDAQIISEEYIHEQETNLSDEALKLKLFLLQIV